MSSRSLGSEWSMGPSCRGLTRTSSGTSVWPLTVCASAVTSPNHGLRSGGGKRPSKRGSAIVDNPSSGATHTSAARVTDPGGRGHCRAFRRRHPSALRQQLRRSPLGPAGLPHFAAVVVHRGQPERMRGHGVVVEPDSVGNQSCGGDVRPEPRVSSADLRFGHIVTTVGGPVRDTTDRDLLRHEDHMQRHEVASGNGPLDQVDLARVTEHGLTDERGPGPPTSGCAALPPSPPPRRHGPSRRLATSGRQSHPH